MARRPRILYQGAVYHVHTRGNRKCSIFEDDQDRRSFMERIVELHQVYEVLFYGVCLMGTHYHCVLETPRANLPDAMRQLNGTYAQQTNKRHGRTGHLFEGPYSAHIIERDRYLRKAIRYLALNPVEGGLVSDPAEWPWSTYRATAGLDSCPPWLTLEWLPWAFGVQTLGEAQHKFVAYVTRQRKREVINWNKISYGTPEFEAALNEVARRRLAERQLPRKPDRQSPPPLSTLFATVTSLSHRDRLVELAHRTHGYSLAEISRHLHVHSSTATKILRRLERGHQRQ